MSTVLDNLVNRPYQHGFRTDIEAETAPKGLNEDIIRLISAKKNEPEWLLEFRLSAYRNWLTMQEPTVYRRVRIPAGLKWELRDKLDQANVNERVLFPGLDGLSRWLARYYMPPPSRGTVRAGAARVTGSSSPKRRTRSRR